ncbi:MAG: CopG family antitoxin [Campylobacterota bacterium]|nr:CopG family antitoxin [Campylobacterota bacterium]
METNYIDNQEKELIDSLKNLDLLQIKNDEENSKLLKKSAKAFVKKEETKMNIRISSSELEKIKAVAQQEGLKYQTFIKSVLHKYITGQLTEKKHRPAI